MNTRRSSQRSSTQQQPSQKNARKNASQQPSTNRGRNNNGRSSQSQVSSSQEESVDYDLDRMVTEVVQYLLISEQRHFPVKKADITKLLGLKGHCASTFKSVIIEAAKFLENVFGYHLLEFDEKTGHYVLENMIKPISPHTWIEPEANNGLLYIILTTIYMSDGEFSEEETWKMLATLGYTQEESEQQKITQDFIKQLYLIKEPVLPTGDVPKFILKWGERAHIEFPKLKILEFASTAYECPMEEFGNLFIKAKKEDKKRQAEDNTL